MQAGKPHLIIAPRVTLMRFTLCCPATAGRAQNPRFHARPIWAANLCCYAEGKSGADRQAWNHVVRCTAASPAAAAVCRAEIVRLPAQRCDARHLFPSPLHKWWHLRSPEPFNDHNYRTDAGGKKVFNDQSGAEPRLGKSLEKCSGEPLSQWNVYSRATHGSKLLTRLYSSVYSPGRLAPSLLSSCKSNYCFCWVFFKLSSCLSSVMQYRMVQVVLQAGGR